LYTDPGQAGAARQRDDIDFTDVTPYAFQKTVPLLRSGARRSCSSEHCNFNATAGNILASQFDRAVGPLIQVSAF
jgi:hypothetical protein